MLVGAGEGFAVVERNGAAIAVGESSGQWSGLASGLSSGPASGPASGAVTVTSTSPTRDSHSHSHSHSHSVSMLIHRTCARSLTVHAGLYELLIENADHYLDLVSVAVASWRSLLEEVRPEGLLGRTWNATVEMPPQEEQYRERDSNITGCNTPMDLFCAAHAVG